MNKRNTSIYAIIDKRDNGIRSSYNTLGGARKGFSHIWPRTSRAHYAIAEFTLNEIIEDGAVIAERQDLAREERKREIERAKEKYNMEFARRNFEQARQRLQELEAKEALLIKI